MNRQWWETCPNILDAAIQQKFNCPTLYQSFSYLKKEPIIFKSKQKSPNGRSCYLNLQNPVGKASLPSLSSVKQSKKGRSLYEDLAQQIQPHLAKIVQSSKNELEIIYHLIEDVQSSAMYERIRKFKQNCWHMKLFNNYTQILFHSLYAEAALVKDNFRLAVHNFQFCEYYALKEELYLFSTHCLWEQSSIWMSIGESELAFRCLKSSLELTIVAKNKQMELKALQKIGLLHYYSGNIGMGEYYHKLSQKDGLPSFESDFYFREFNKEDEVAALEFRLFGIENTFADKRKFNTKHEIDKNRDIFEQIGHKIAENKLLVSEMLKDKQTNKLGFIIRSHFRRNMEIARVKEKENTNGNRLKKSLHYSRAFPMQGCSQVIKSHLSKSRVVRMNREINLRRVIDLIQQIKQAAL